MKIKISAKDVINYKSLFPQANNILSMRIQMDIEKKIDYTQEEMEAINLKVVTTGEEGQTGYTWDKNAAPKEVELTVNEHEYLKECIQKQDKAKQINVNLYEFVIQVMKEEG